MYITQRSCRASDLFRLNYSLSIFQCVDCLGGGGGTNPLSIILNVLNSLDNKLLTPTFSAWTAWACPRGSGGATHEIKRGERKAALQVIFFGG